MKIFLTHTGPDKVLVRFRMEGDGGMLAEGIEVISEGGNFMGVPFAALFKQGDGEVELKDLKKASKVKE